MSDLLANIAHWRTRRSYPPRMLMEAASHSLSVRTRPCRRSRPRLPSRRVRPGPGTGHSSARPVQGSVRPSPGPAELPAVSRPSAQSVIPQLPWGPLLSTRSFIARPTETDYNGIYVHFDGHPSSKLPLLLASFQHKFARDVEAMARHLVDDVAIGWDKLGTDPLDNAPPEITEALTGGQQRPSRIMNHLIAH
ncbi:hypothetical protein [Streptomyces niveus]|uniref:hypothetical protein n=1 Tax=Streptomyces niveus TaxID=193462 RepID=UPI00369DF653